MEKQEIRTFGRRHGKKLSARKQQLMANVLPALRPGHSADILEIGFGAGEHLRALALQNPDKIIIGAEPFANGVAALLSAICDTENNAVMPEYKNIRIWPDDVRPLLHDSNMKFSQIWILHPDPWPKARHEKRRLLQTEFIRALARRLTIGGEIIIGTDHWGYYDWILEQAAHADVTIETPALDVIKTRYQAKNMAETDNPKYIVIKNK